MHVIHLPCLCLLDLVQVCFRRPVRVPHTGERPEGVSKTSASQTVSPFVCLNRCDSQIIPFKNVISMTFCACVIFRIFLHSCILLIAVCYFLAARWTTAPQTKRFDGRSCFALWNNQNKCHFIEHARFWYRYHRRHEYLIQYPEQVSKHHASALCLSEQTNVSTAEFKRKLLAAPQPTGRDQRGWVTDVYTCTYIHITKHCPVLSVIISSMQWAQHYRWVMYPIRISFRFNGGLRSRGPLVQFKAKIKKIVLEYLYFILFFSDMLRVRECRLLLRCPHTPLTGGSWAAADSGPEDGQSRGRDGARCGVAHWRYASARGNQSQHYLFWSVQLSISFETSLRTNLANFLLYSPWEPKKDNVEQKDKMVW